MPLFKCSASKAKPKNGIAYITDEKKAKIVSVRNLFEDEDYAKQFDETANRFGKGDKFDERKYYHCKLSCARQDNISPEKAHAYAEELVAKLFQNYECVIATHTDTQTVHSHIIVNAVDPITGKKLQFNKQDYVKMKDEANRIGKKYGFTETDFRKRGKNSRTAIEKKIMLKCGTSWKEELREVIAEATKNSTTPDNFAEEVAEAFFKNYECVIATHTDTQTVHSHIIVNAVDPITGKKLQFSKQDYAKMKDEVNAIGRKYGFTETEFRKRGKNSRTAAEKKIILKGGTSWKEELREVIAEAVKKTKSPEAFKDYLNKCYGVKITRDGKDYSYLHPNKQKPIRGERLGTNYTKSEVIKRIGEQNNRVKSGTYNGRSGFNGKRTGTGTVRRSKAANGGNAGSVVRASLGGIEREMQRLNFAAECAGNGLDAASEERKMDERRARLESERRRREADERDERRKSEHACKHADNASKDNGNGNEDTGNSKYNYGKGD